MDEILTDDEEYVKLVEDMKLYRYRMMHFVLQFKDYIGRLDETDLHYSSNNFTAEEISELKAFRIPSSAKRYIKRDIVKYLNRNIKESEGIRIEDLVDSHNFYDKHDILHNYKFKITRRDMRALDECYRLPTKQEFPADMDKDLDYILLYNTGDNDCVKCEIYYK